MNTPNPQDFERLSAYMDNQLSAAEKAELEARLAKEPELQAHLTDLRRTVRALRSLPTVKPPRSFTLTPEQAGIRVRRGPLFPAFRLAAALCTLLLAVAVARDFATSGGLAASTINDTTTQSGVATAVLQPNAAPLLTPTPGIETNGAGAVASNVSTPTSTSADNYAATPQLRMSVAVPSATVAVGAQQPDATAGPTVKGAAASETPGSLPLAHVVPSSTPADTAASAAAMVSATPEGAAPLPPAPGLSGLRLVEIALAGLALILAVATWLTRRG